MILARLLNWAADVARRAANRLEPLAEEKREHYAQIRVQSLASAADKPWCCPKCGCQIELRSGVYHCSGLHTPEAVQRYIDHWNMSHWRANPPAEVESCGWNEPDADYGRTWICPPP